MFGRPLGWLLVLYVAKKTTGPVYFITVGQIQERESKGGFKETTYKY